MSLTKEFRLLKKKLFIGLENEDCFQEEKFYKSNFLIIIMEAKILNFRRGRHTVKEKHYLIEVPGVKNRKDAEKFVGKSVEWESPGKRSKVIKGKISGVHGNKGVVRAIFEKGLPGQAITDKVEVKEK